MVLPSAKNFKEPSQEPSQSAAPGATTGALPVPVKPESRICPAAANATAVLSLDCVRARLSPALAAALPGLFGEAPDPAGALLLFERLTESPEIVRLLDQHNFLAHYAIVV